MNREKQYNLAILSGYYLYCRFIEKISFTGYETMVLGDKIKETDKLQELFA